MPSIWYSAMSRYLHDSYINFYMSTERTVKITLGTFSGRYTWKHYWRGLRENYQRIQTKNNNHSKTSKIRGKHYVMWCRVQINKTLCIIRKMRGNAVWRRVNKTFVWHSNTKLSIVGLLVQYNILFYTWSFKFQNSKYK